MEMSAPRTGGQGEWLSGWASPLSRCCLSVFSSCGGRHLGGLCKSPGSMRCFAGWVATSDRWSERLGSERITAPGVAASAPAVNTSANSTRIVTTFIAATVQDCPAATTLTAIHEVGFISAYLPILYRGSQIQENALLSK